MAVFHPLLQNQMRWSRWEVMAKLSGVCNMIIAYSWVTMRGESKGEMTQINQFCLPANSMHWYLMQVRWNLAFCESHWILLCWAREGIDSHTLYCFMTQYLCLSRLTVLCCVGQWLYIISVDDPRTDAGQYGTITLGSVWQPNIWGNVNCKS